MNYSLPCGRWPSPGRGCASTRHGSRPSCRWVPRTPPLLGSRTPKKTAHDARPITASRVAYKQTKHEHQFQAVRQAGRRAGANAASTPAPPPSLSYHTPAPFGGSSTGERPRCACAPRPTSHPAFPSPQVNVPFAVHARTVDSDMNAVVGPK